jgi:hypothetical protein
MSSMSDNRVSLVDCDEVPDGGVGEDEDDEVAGTEVGGILRRW